ncbi:MAG: HAD hydrolase-like protein [Ruminococcus sp.]|nr:HAD hydrolase-like protein [Ruminococcus sp.]
MSITYDTLLFDLDGTLIDSAPGVLGCLKKALGTFGIPEPQELKRFMGPPLTDSLKMFCGLEGQAAEKVLNSYRELYSTEGIFNTTAYSGIEKMLEKLSEEGKTLAVATCKSEDFALRILNDLGIAKYFDFIGGSDIASGRNSKDKVIEYVMENLGQPDRNSTLMIGDRLYDVNGAGKCGIGCLYALWGYGSTDEAKACGAHDTVTTTESCTDYVLGRQQAAG